jgi:hypothetical protein
MDLFLPILSWSVRMVQLILVPTYVEPKNIRLAQLTTQSNQLISINWAMSMKINQMQIPSSYRHILLYVVTNLGIPRRDSISLAPISVHTQDHQGKKLSFFSY